mgnify:CR=1 FL=1|tara:strand:+ start:548 stop:943 length:396 start_codon:yes stop_codon:yes gene_type:complete
MSIKWPPQLNMTVCYYENNFRKKYLCKVIRIENNNYFLKTIQTPSVIFNVNSLCNVYLYGRWKNMEKEMVILYYKIHGTNWSEISKKYMNWKSPSQIRSHMQKILKNKQNIKILSPSEKSALGGLLEIMKI